MKAALLSLVTVTALALSAGPADARPPRYRAPVIVYPSINTSPYVYPNYYPNYYPNSVYPASGITVNFGRFGLNIGNGYTYPSYGNWSYGSGYYYTQPYSWRNRGWRW